MVDPVLLRRGSVVTTSVDDDLPNWDPRRSFAERFPAESRSKVYLYENAPPETVAHELGHAVEYHNDALFREAAAFLDRRTTGPTRPLPNLPGERFRSGFKRDYDGEIYEGGGRGNHHRVARLANGTEVGATEVIASGLEKMHEDPWKFAHEEPEYVDFILTRVLFRETP